ncbi:MAG TPA: LuxR C-terminal-related transcriptional regulator [Chloroflexota bacterium]|nr:LuxR C-terminal-related transcriptional regulator [Chloroflexota bacterium]
MPRSAGLLTTREREVARLVARGLTNRQIAEALVVTEKTAANHVQHVLDKLEVTRVTSSPRALPNSAWCERNGSSTGRGLCRPSLTAIITLGEGR